jgi:uncharacterized Zn finger protein
VGYRWAPYVPVWKRKAQAAKKIKAAQKKGQRLNPIFIEGRTIAKTFWGKAWCDHLENYSDYENRFPRGRTYVRNGSVLDLQVSKGRVDAQVMGTSLYTVAIQIKPMPQERWQKLIKECAGKIDSLIELLQGKFSKAVMSILISEETQLFPSAKEIAMECSCPDYAGMCKHIAATLYGIGTAIDSQPEWLFALRHLDHLELIASATTNEIVAASQTSDNVIDEHELSALFNIELKTSVISPTKKKEVPKKRGK